MKSDTEKEQRGPCVDCGRWFSTRNMEHVWGDAGCLSCGICSGRSEYRVRRTWFGLGRKIVEKRVVTGRFSMIDAATGYGEEWFESTWERVN